MITAKTNENNASYSALFEEAFKYLAANVNSIQNEARREAVQTFINNRQADADARDTTARFTSVQEYFSHLKDLLDAGGKKFLMLPLDEPVFEIDANKREITVPAVFKKNGISVKGDEIAESLIFRINRFFDYADLNEMIVQVQWENANKEQGISDIYVVDAERSADYLYLMWPLTEKITRYPGTIKFSVRFYNALESGKLAYSFATKIAAATINDGHNFNMTDGSLGDVDTASMQFANAIANSKNTAAEEAAAPYFLLNLDSKENDPSENADYIDTANGVLEAYIDADNTPQILRVQATTTDTGIIGYEWYYVDTLQPGNMGGKLYRLKSSADYQPCTDATAIPNKKYYVQSGVDNLGEPEYSEVKFEDIQPGQTFYERFSIVRVEDGHRGTVDGETTDEILQHVVGRYYVKAFNYVGEDDNMTQSYTVEFPGPDVVEFAEGGELSRNVYMTNGVGAIEVHATVDERGAKASYRWLYSETGEVFTDITDPGFPAASKSKLSVNEDGNILTISGLPGYYKVQVVSTRNYHTKTIESEGMCKVTELTKAPRIVRPAQDTPVSSRYHGAHLEIEVEVLTNEFETEGMTFQWYKAGRTEEENVAIETAQGSGIVPASGIITFDTDRYDTDSYFCIITNKIGTLLNTTKSPVFSVGYYEENASGSSEEEIPSGGETPAPAGGDDNGSDNGGSDNGGSEPVNPETPEPETDDTQG